MDFIDKRIFLKNFKKELTSADCARELKQVAGHILKENKLNSTKTKVSDKDIQRLKQVLWILEANK